MTEEDWRMLHYFWFEKGDLERWCGWDKFKAANPHHPIVEAQARYVSAGDTLTLLIRGAQP